MFAMLPPLTNNPPHDGGKPMNSAIQRTVCSSISVAAGDSDHAPTVRVDRRREHVRQHADRRRGCRDVPEESRMPVERRVVEQQSGGVAYERRRIGPVQRQSHIAANSLSHLVRRRVGATRRSIANRRHELGDLIDELMPCLPKTAAPSSRRVRHACGLGGLAESGWSTCGDG